MMDWTDIKEKYPKAYGKFIFWNVKRLEKILSGQMVTADLLRDMIESAMCHNRHLYDFFDEQGIIVIVSFNEPLGWFSWRIFIKNEQITYVNNINSRTEAEEEVFEKAFEILENQLK